MSLQFKKCTLDDLEKLVWISETTFFDAFAAKNTEKAMKDYMSQAFNPQQLKSEIDNPESAFYFSYLDDELVGFFKINIGNAQVEIFQEKTIELGRLYVLKEFRNKKIGEQMLEKAIQMGKEMGVEFIWLGVWDRNPEAIRFYERHGFQKFGQHPFFMGEEEQTDFLYRLHLNQL